jgi:hypothetical protein
VGEDGGSAVQLKQKLLTQFLQISQMTDKVGRHINMAEICKE